MFVLQSKWWNPGDKVELGEAFSSKVCWIPWMQQGFLTPLCFPYSTDFPARVVRARGPAARKEVTIATSKEEACRAVQEIMQVHKSWIHPCHSSSGCSVLWEFVIPARSLELIFGRNFLIQLKSFSVSPQIPPVCPRQGRELLWLNFCSSLKSHFSAPPNCNFFLSSRLDKEYFSTASLCPNEIPLVFHTGTSYIHWFFLLKENEDLGSGFMAAHWGFLLFFYRTECLERWLLLKNCFKGKNFLYVIDGVMLCFYFLTLILCFCTNTQVYYFKFYYLHLEKCVSIVYI